MHDKAALSRLIFLYTSDFVMHGYDARNVSIHSISTPQSRKGGSSEKDVFVESQWKKAYMRTLIRWQIRTIPAKFM